MAQRQWSTRGGPRLAWTEARDTQLRRLRAEGQGWPGIGAALGVSADVARERGRRIGARRAVVADAPAEDVDFNDPDRDPLPAGHPHAWALLTVGTLLSGIAWPGYAA